ncbi:LIC_10190 family membrane protein [Spirosoma flavus]
MIAQFLVSLLYVLCFLTIGGILKKIIGWSTSYYYDLLIGFACLNAVFTTISIAYPVNEKSLCIFLCILFMVAFRYRKWLSFYISNLTNYLLIKIINRPIIFSVISLFIIITFFQSLYTPNLHYDAALYHVPAIKWTREHSTIAGLANLNIVLGYNFNIFPLYAAFSLENWFGQAIYSINFTIVSCFCIWLFSIIVYSIDFKRYLFVASLILIFYALIEYYWPHVSTTSNDIIVYILVLSILLAGLSYKRNKDDIYSVVILSTYVITIKLSAIPVLLLAIFIVFSKSYWQSKRKALGTILISAFILIPWLTKNVLITGWLLFPFPYLDLFSVDWKVPLSDVVLQKKVIDTYYLPKDAGSGLSQLTVWFFDHSLVEILTMVMASTFLVILFSKLITKKLSINQFHLASIIVSALGILFMFLSSPSLRYCISFFLAAIALCINILDTQQTSNKYVFYAPGLLLALIFLKNNWNHPWHFAKNISQRLLIPYPLESANMPTYSYFLIDKKVKCYYPLDTDQCFNHALPCTSHLLSNVHLRGLTIEEGFYKAELSK